MKPAQRRSRHGLNAAMVRVKLRGFQAVDRRTVAARTALAWRRDMLDHLGGEATCTVPQITLVELATRSWLFVTHCDAYLLGQRSLVNGRKRSLIPLVRERQALVDSLARILAQLGLARVAPAVPSLATYLREKYPAPAPAAPPKDDPHPAPDVALQETSDDRTDHAPAQ